MTSLTDRAKRAAALHAASLVEDGMVVGLGTGSTAAFLVARLGERVRDEGLRLAGVPTSQRTADLAAQAGIALRQLDGARLDLAVDGADEADASLNLIKGGGGALLREKIVAAAADRVVIIVDAAKRVEALGAFPLPVEVVRFGCQATQGLVEETLGRLGLPQGTGSLRMSGEEPFVTDEGHHILDLRLGRIEESADLALALAQIPGVVESGLFVGLCDALVVGHEDGRVEVVERETGSLGLTS